MKSRFHWALALAALIPVVASAADGPPQREKSSMASKGAGIELVDLIERVAKRTGKQFILDPHISTQIPLAGLGPDDVDYPKLLAILTVHQLVAYESGGVVHVVPDAISRQLPVPVSSEIPAATLDDELVMVVVTAKNACAAQLVPALRPLMPQAAHFAALPQANTLLISDHAGNARRIIDLIGRLDRASPAGQKCPELPSPVPRMESRPDAK